MYSANKRWLDHTNVSCLKLRKHGACINVNKISSFNRFTVDQALSKCPEELKRHYAQTNKCTNNQIYKNARTRNFIVVRCTLYLRWSCAVTLSLVHTYHLFRSEPLIVQQVCVHCTF